MPWIASLQTTSISGLFFLTMDPVPDVLELQEQIGQLELDLEVKHQDHDNTKKELVVAELARQTAENALALEEKMAGNALFSTKGPPVLPIFQWEALSGCIIGIGCHWCIIGPPASSASPLPVPGARSRTREKRKKGSR